MDTAFNLPAILLTIGGVIFAIIITTLGAVSISRDKFFVGLLAAIAGGAVTTILAAMGVPDFLLGMALATIILIGNDIGGMTK